MKCCQAVRRTALEMMIKEAGPRGTCVEAVPAYSNGRGEKLWLISANTLAYIAVNILVTKKKQPRPALSSVYILDQDLSWDFSIPK